MTKATENEYGRASSYTGETSASLEAMHQSAKGKVGGSRSKVKKEKNNDAWEKKLLYNPIKSISNNKYN
ncbi:hypothetical protein IDH70_02715 [Mixta calida]|nr:hypothetical protein IDH70_02715 [Mixta calida]